MHNMKSKFPTKNENFTFTKMHEPQLKKKDFWPLNNFRVLFINFSMLPYLFVTEVGNIYTIFQYHVTLQSRYKGESHCTMKCSQLPNNYAKHMTHVIRPPLKIIVRSIRAVRSFFFPRTKNLHWIWNFVKLAVIP